MDSAQLPMRRFLIGGVALCLCAVAGVGGLARLCDIGIFSTTFLVLVIPPVAALVLLLIWGAVQLSQAMRCATAPLPPDSTDDQFRCLLETMGLVPWEADMHTWQFGYVGPQAEKLLGYPVADWFATDFWVNHIYEPDRAVVAARCERACIAGAPAELEYRMVRRDGRLIWVQNFIAVPKSKSGVQVFRGCLVDVTVRKQAEEKVRQSEKMQAISRVAGSAAHDFNNILLAVNGYAESLLRQPLLTLAMRQEVGDIVKAVQQARGLIRQLLAFQNHQQRFVQRLSIDALLRSLQRMLRALLEDKIQLELVAAPALGWVEVDQVELERVILNLVVNARDAMPEGGALTLATADIAADQKDQRPPGLGQGAHVRLTIQDTGVGMTEEVRANLFEPFYSTKGEKGTGLGLYSVYGLVKKYSGHIEVRSALGQGTTFHIFLPSVPADTAPALPSVTPRAASGLPGEQPASAAAGQSASLSATILVVEDEELVRPVYRRMLEGVGFRVLEADDGPQAVRLCEQHVGRIDLMVTDVVMPKINGFELARRLNRDRPEMKVLFVTGFMDVSELGRQQGIALDNLLHKPFMPDTLVKKVREMLTPPS